MARLLRPGGTGHLADPMLLCVLTTQEAVPLPRVLCRMSPVWRPFLLGRVLEGMAHLSVEYSVGGSWWMLTYDLTQERTDPFVSWEPGRSCRVKQQCGTNFPQLLPCQAPSGGG